MISVPEKSKKRQRQGVSSQDILRALPTLTGDSSTQVSNGALEALRLCHESFLSLVASELAAQQERTEEASSSVKQTALQTPQQVMSCLETLDILSKETLHHILEQQQETDKKPAAKSKKKLKQAAVTQEMLDEQERLLEQSRQQALRLQGKG